MQLIITDAWWAKSRTLYLSGLQVVAYAVVSACMVMVLVAALYHQVILRGAREGWPVIGTAVRWVVREDVEQRERYVRENIDVMARRLGELQVQLLQLESLGERVAGLAGIKTNVGKGVPGQGGAWVPGPALSITDLQSMQDRLEISAQQQSDVFTMLESRLFDRKLAVMRIPTQTPTVNGEISSPFGWRMDPVTGHSALHSGLDFRATTGEAILAAAGGVVVVQDYHPEYGNMIEIDHGNAITTRYAHASKTWVKKGDLIKRGQKIAEVGTSGRSTGSHLHFEVLIQGIAHDPQKFLLAGHSLHALVIAAQGARPKAQQ